MNTYIDPAIQQAAGTLIDHLMNDETIASQMSTYVGDKMTKLGLDPDEVATEDTPSYNLYYALTAEFHSRVLSVVQLGLAPDHEPKTAEE